MRSPFIESARVNRIKWTLALVPTSSLGWFNLKKEAFFQVEHNQGDNNELGTEYIKLLCASNEYGER